MSNAFISRLKRRLSPDRITLATIQLSDVLSATPDLILALPAWSQDRRAGDVFDSVTIASIARAKQPGVYFEIGTGDGRSSLLVAANTPPSSKLFTLDPFYPQDPVKGSVFRGKPEAAKIQQLGGFSTRFDFSPWHGKADLVFVDGGHQFEDVVNDTAVAFRLISPTGWIIWHDVATDTPGVVKALELSERAQSIRLIVATRYAIYQS